MLFEFVNLVTSGHLRSGRLFEGEPSAIEPANSSNFRAASPAWVSVAQHFSGGSGDLCLGDTCFSCAVIQARMSSGSDLTLCRGASATHSQKRYAQVFGWLYKTGGSSSSTAQPSLPLQAMRLFPRAARLEGSRCSVPFPGPGQFLARPCPPQHRNKNDGLWAQT